MTCANGGKKILGWLLALLVAAVVAPGMAAGGGETPGLCFYLPFEGSLDATKAKGASRPIEASLYRFIDGVRGKAVVVRDRGWLRYHARQNIDKARGSLLLWVRPSWGAQAPGLHTLFREDGEIHTGDNVFTLMTYPGWVQFLLDDKADRFRKSRVFWEPMEWHHVALTWDAAKGAWFYLDGALQSYNLSDGIHIEEPFSWAPKEHKEIIFGECRPAGEAAGSEEADAAFDEVKIYSRVLSAQEVLDDYCSSMTAPDVYLPWNAFPSGRESRTRLELVNRCPGSALSGTLVYRIVGNGTYQGPEVASKHLDSASGRSTTIDISIPPLGPGEYRIGARWNGLEQALRSIPVFVYEPAVPPKEGQGGGETRTLTTISCARERSPDIFCADQGARSVGVPFGEYLEGGQKEYSRFAFRFQVEKPHVPHRVIVTYPDDKERIFDMVINGPQWPQTYDVGTGVFLGNEYPLTNRMQTHSIIFWPRERENALTFMNWEKGRPAAVSEIRVEEISGGLEPMSLELPPQGVPRRLVGLYWEDSRLHECLGWDGSSAQGFDRGVRNLMEYMRHMGMNALMYPTVTYGGPYYNSRLEGFRGSNRYGSHPLNFVEIILERCREAGVSFYAIFNVGATVNLIDRAIEAGLAGVPAEAMSFRTITKDNRATGRWGEDLHSLFNPLHPVVQEEIKGLVREHMERFGASEAFRGIAFHLVAEDMTWLGSLEQIYDDYSVGEFEKETGTCVPVDPGDPKRFSKRYEWIAKNARAAWTRWRCSRIARFYEDIAGIIRAGGADRELVLSVFMPCGRGVDHARWSIARQSVGEMLLEAGFDIQMLESVPGVRIQRFFHPADYRLMKLDRANRGKPTLETVHSRDLFFDPASLSVFLAGKNISANLFYVYFEADAGKNPIPGFWWDPLRGNVSTVAAGHASFMEYPAHAMATFDPWLLTFSGFQIPTIGHEDDLRPFLKALRALPAVPFEAIEGMEDPVVMRYARCGRSLYLSLVNREYYPVKVSWLLEAGKGRAGSLQVIDLVRAKEVGVGRRAGAQKRMIGLEMAPYELKAFRVEPGSAEIVGATSEVPAEVTEELAQRYESLKKRMHGRGWWTGARDAADIAGVMDSLEKAFREDPPPYSRIRHLLESYAVQKALQ